ncbi:DUF2207 domain-containing protein [Lederbergia panacisoli]|uniref:DUF2207 domain-containing protein n=1 Tax=Lederbergia panacisoli TaxID=1255251 RepID=UPI00214C18B2|nr:DUF2207 domain-containing protein [Lederbergia panacisoli]MCR2823345.1 DUF2207 domain-containing protein [Lederbergia panacisoli]
MKRSFIVAFVIFFILMIPVQVFAVDFSITNVKIDAYMLENGDVDVKEVHTYSFESKFNGITREIIPKKGAEITNFLANEDGKTLKVEKKGHLYKVHRKGKNEEINVELQYKIKNGVSKYTDMTEFYWPFFDQRNESPYGEMTIIIHPPKQTDDVIAFGYDRSFRSEQINQNGIVQFNLGKVLDGENGDIRVAYDSSLFPGMTTTSNTKIKDQLVKEKESLEIKAEQFAENQKNMSIFGIYAIIITLILLIGISAIEYLSAKRKRALVIQEIEKLKLLVPSQKMSMAATIMHTKGLTQTGIVAALLDLVRKGNVEQVSDDEFIILNRNSEQNHEKILIEWLFDEIGENGVFRSGDIDEYIKNKKNLQTYNGSWLKWYQAVKKEVKDFGVYEKKVIVKGLFGLISILMIPLSVLLINYELFLLLFFSIVLCMFGLGMAIFYKPLSWEGLTIRHEWWLFSNRLNKIMSLDWKNTTEDTRMRAVMYQLGTEKKVNPRSQKNIEPWQNEIGRADDSMMMYYLITAPVLTSGFSRAEAKYKQSVAADSSSSGSSSGGVGGGGGGSGAF